ncbi:MAG: M20/M25/M40 family metallo-hydrolase [Bacteroidales bacterium]|nr:M20/M25/M40 family metallo-hydrolase [Bacteroidales bacterium]
MRNEIHRLTAEAVDLLKEMVAIPSPSFSEDAVCCHISEWMTARGLAHERIGNNIVAEHITDPSKPVLMLCAHIDTVSPGEGYEFDPYEPDYDVAAEVIGRMTGDETGIDDIVAGLGSNDDGASVVSMLAAYRRLSRRDHIPPHNDIASSDDGNNMSLRAERGNLKSECPNLLLVLSCEEERSGRNGMTGLWGSRICRRGEEVEGCTPVDFAIIGEPTGMRVSTSERGLLVIDATAHGVSGHAARNEGVNALYMALDDIAKLRAHEFGKVSERMGKVNLNVTQISAGTAHNVIPDRCDFVIDIRPTEQYTNEELLAELQSICTSELKARNLANRSSATFKDSTLQRAAEALGIETFSSPTTSDWMRISCDAVKMGPGDSSRSHRRNEFVFVREIEEGIEQYINFIEHLL